VSIEWVLGCPSNNANHQQEEESMKLKAILAASIVTGALFAGGQAESASWEPKKPIQLIVGFAAGGATDLIARAIATSAQEIISVQLVVINRPGAAGVIAAESVAKGPADRYTLLLAGGSEITAIPNHQKVAYSVSGSFRPVIHLVRLRIMINVRADSGFKSFKDLVNYAKANPGKLAYGTGGTGGLTHSSMLLVNKVAAIDTFDVPYKGDSEVVTALMSSQIQIVPVSPDQVKSWIDSGKVRPLAVTSNDRFPGYPDVPTLKELGYDVYLENMNGLVAPAGLPDEVYTYLHDHLKSAMETGTFKAFAARGDFEVTYMDGPTFGRAMQSMSNAIASALKK
jgi:tripartite-type tricarboxylate transporter receptor subunit TctC